MAVLRTVYLMLALAFQLGFKFTWNYLQVVFQLEEKRRKLAPKGHQHLLVIGTLPDEQGKGYGTRVLQQGLERADQAGVACWLESSNPSNVPFYKKAGFHVMEEIYPFATDDDDKGPCGHLMLRQRKRDKVA